MTAELTIFDQIGTDPETGAGTTAKQFDANLKALGNPSAILVRINSPGGDVMEAMGIYTMLKACRSQVTVRIEGLAASAASLIAMAADTIEIAENAFLLIHMPWSTATGSADDLAAVAEDLERMSDTYAGIYAARSGQSVKAVTKLMQEDRLMTANEAIQLGYADKISDFSGASPNMSTLPRKHRATIRAARRRPRDVWGAAIALVKGERKPRFATNRKADASWERAIAGLKGENHRPEAAATWDLARQKVFGEGRS